MSSDQFEYEGDELEVFALARNWKAYFRDKFLPYLGRNVLEVGAGFGAVTRTLLHAEVERWTCLEPDAMLASRIPETLSDHPMREQVQVRRATTLDLAAETTYDTILYVDVLEHIEDDRAELRRAASHLSAGGYCIVLSPAYNWLYTPFDKAIGHFRRYTARTLSAVAPADVRLADLYYLDSVALLASLANKLLLRQSLPTRAQILFWDRTLVPISRVVDPLIRYKAGRSVIALWQKL